MGETREYDHVERIIRQGNEGNENGKKGDYGVSTKRSTDLLTSFFKKLTVVQRVSSSYLGLIHLTS